MNAGVDAGAIEREFGGDAAARAMEVVRRLAVDGLVNSDGKTVRLTAQGRLLSNFVFAEFLGLVTPTKAAPPANGWTTACR